MGPDQVTGKHRQQNQWERATGVLGLDFLIHTWGAGSRGQREQVGPDASKALRLPTDSTSLSIRICLWELCGLEQILMLSEPRLPHLQTGYNSTTTQHCSGDGTTPGDTAQPCDSDHTVQNYSERARSGRGRVAGGFHQAPAAPPPSCTKLAALVPGCWGNPSGPQPPSPLQSEFSLAFPSPRVPQGGSSERACPSPQGWQEAPYKSINKFQADAHKLFGLEPQPFSAVAAKPDSLR